MAAPTIRGYWDGSTLIPVTVRGSYDGVSGHAPVSVTLRSTSTGSVAPTPNPAPASAQSYGVSATNGSPFATQYASQTSALHSKACYYYDTSQTPTWGPVAAVPSTHDIWYQTKSTDTSSYAALLASMPATRTGKVYLHYFNEPEDNIASGGLALSDWQARTDALFAAIGDSGKTYVIPSIEIQYYTLQQTNKGAFGTNGSRNVANYIRPGLRQIGWSAYAEKKVKADASGVNHEVATTSPVNMPTTIQTYMATLAGVNWSTITGWAVDSAYLSDPVTIQNRVNWFLDSSANLTAAGSKHYLWFDIPWANGDYRIETDPQLLSAWQSTLTNAGQW